MLRDDKIMLQHMYLELIKPSRLLSYFICCSPMLVKTRILSLFVFVLPCEYLNMFPSLTKGFCCATPLSDRAQRFIASRFNCSARGTGSQLISSLIFSAKGSVLLFGCGFAGSLPILAWLLATG